MSEVYDNALALIGQTPLVRVQHLDTGPCELYLKLENQNPGGSIKDRIGLTMIEEAERAGHIKPGDTLVEGTAGNTGLALALVAQQKGYHLILVIPDKMSREKIFNLKAMGAEVILTRSDVGKGHPEYYQDMAERIANERDDAYFINQFGNPNNPLAHERTTAPEILEQLDGDVDAVVLGCGSSGTVTGLSRYYREHKPDLELVLADPEGSILTHYIETGEVLEDGGGWMVEGIGEDFLPDISDFSFVKRAFTIPDRDSFLAGRELLLKEGIFGGSSTGTNIAAALKYCQQQTEPKKVVTFVCDTGNKYLSKMYNDFWMLDQGFIEREQFGDLRDLIGRPHTDRDTIVAKPNDLLSAAYARMKLYDVSQLPVLDDGHIVGMVDESDVLLAVYGNEDAFKEPVSSAMVTKLEKIERTRSVESLLPIFDAGKVAIVMDGERFLGLITRIDLLNYLRRKVD